MPGAPDALIAAALTDQPIPGDKAGLTALKCAVEPIRDGLRVTASMVLPAGQGPETVVMEPAAPVWVSDAVVTRAGDSLTATADLVPLPGQPFDLDPATLRLTMLSTGRAIEVLGFVNPVAAKGETVRIDADKAKVWLQKGAQPSKTVLDLFKKNAIL